MRASQKLLLFVSIGIAVASVTVAQAQTPGVTNYYWGAIMQGNFVWPPDHTYTSYAWIEKIPQAKKPDRFDAVFFSWEEGNKQEISFYQRARIGNTIYLEGDCWYTSHGRIHAAGWINPTQLCVYAPWSGDDWVIMQGTNPMPAVVSNAGGVSGVTAGSATLNGSLDSSGSDTPSVSVYWGTADHGMNTAGWDHAVSLGTPSGLTQAAGVVTVGILGNVFTNTGAGLVGPLSATATGLNPGTTYYYRFYAVNSGGAAWGDPAIQFKSASSPAVNNGGAINITAGSALLKGNLTAGGNANVTVYWGTVDGGTTVSSWQHSTTLNSLSEGAFSCAVSGLNQAATYYYRCYAANVAGTGWAGSSATFQTLPVLPVGWACKMKITFSGYNKSETLANFPALIVLNQSISGFQYSQFQTAGGGDLRFTDANSTEIPYEIDTWNSSGSSYVWVNVPQIANGSSYIWAYWGLSGATAPVYTTNGAAWPAGVSAVWHMNQANALDSSSNANSGVVSGTVTPVSSSLTGGADQFNSNGCIIVSDSQTFRPPSALSGYGGAPSAPLVPQDALTISFWLQSDNGGTPLSRMQVPGVEYPWPAGSGTAIYNNEGGYAVNDAGWDIGDGYINWYYSGYVILPTGRPDSSSAWHYYALANDGSNLYYYRDGVSLGNSALSQGAFASGDADCLCIGANNLDGSAKLKGTLDEVRVENALRSANWIWACNMTMAANSVFSTYEVESLGETTAPAAPSNLTATPVTSSQINLAWTDNSNNEIRFLIERKTGSGGTYAQIGTVGPNVTVYTDTGLTGGTTYYYRVRASNSVGNSGYSNEANAMTLAPTIPNAPSGLTTTAIGTTQINLAWTDNSNNEDGFLIERKAGSGGTYAQIATVSANVTNYSDTGLSPATTYYYRVRAENGVGDSGYSNEANAMTQAMPTIPNAPSGLTASAPGSSQANLSWTDNSTNETGFLIERKTGSGGTYAQIATVGANVTAYTDTGLSGTTTYYYRIRSTNAAGNSGYSNEASATTPSSSAMTITFCGGSYASPYTVPAGSYSGAISLDAVGGGDILNQPNSTTVTASQLSIGQSDSTGTETYNLTGGSLSLAGNVYLAAHNGHCASTLAISGSGSFSISNDFYFGDWPGSPESATLDISGNGVFNQPNGQLQFGTSNSFLRVTGGNCSITALYYRIDGHAIGGITFTLDSSANHISPLVATSSDFDLSGSSGKIHIATSGFSPTVGQTFDLIKIPQNGTIGVPTAGANALLNADSTANWSLSVVTAVGGYDILRATALTGGGPSSTTVHGIPYSWLTDHGITNTSDSIETACLNGNGLNVLQDYVAGMDPTNRNSCFGAVIASVAGQIVVSVPSILTSGADYSGKTRCYDIEQCASILTGASWQPVPNYTNVPASGGVIAFTNATPTSVKFYRARVWLQ